YCEVAVDTYRFLLHGYPANHFAHDAMLRMGKLQKDQLGDAVGARETFEEFLKKYPRSKSKREAQEALAEMALLRSGETAAPVAEARLAHGIAGNDAKKEPAAREAPRGGGGGETTGEARPGRAGGGRTRGARVA